MAVREGARRKISLPELHCSIFIHVTIKKMDDFP
jgi:hypothetical protein